MYDKPSKLAGEVLWEISQVEVPSRQQHQDEGCSGRLGKGDEPPMIVLPDITTADRRARTARGTVFAPPRWLGYLWPGERNNSKAFGFEGKDLPRRQSRQGQSPFCVCGVKDVGVKLVGCERH
jgi:hypothetical protein